MMFGPQLGSCSFWLGKDKTDSARFNVGGSNWKKTITHITLYIYIWFVWALQRHEFTSFAPLNECPKDPIPTV